MAFSEPRTRGDIWIWVTWLTKFMALENACLWALWFKARFQYDKLPRGADLERWTQEHDALVQHRVRQLEADGYSVYVEDYNKFSVKGTSGATISGKPDIVAIKDSTAIFEDCKTGKRRASDHYQVLLYIVLGNQLKALTGCEKLEGNVVYPDGVETVDLSLTEHAKVELRKLVSLIMSPTPPVAVASPRECLYCDISDYYCDDRINGPDGAVYVTDVF